VVIASFLEMSLWTVANVDSKTKILTKALKCCDVPIAAG
jgi:hypothetical protein